MKKRYMMPTIRAVEMDNRAMLDTMSDGEEIDVPVDPSKPKDPGEAMSREIPSFSLWDAE